MSRLATRKLCRYWELIALVNVVRLIQFVTKYTIINRYTYLYFVLGNFAKTVAIENSVQYVLKTCMKRFYYCGPEPTASCNSLRWMLTAPSSNTGQE